MTWAEFEAEVVRRRKAGQTGTLATTLRLEARSTNSIAALPQEDEMSEPKRMTDERLRNLCEQEPGLDEIDAEEVLSELKAARASEAEKAKVIKEMAEVILYAEKFLEMGTMSARERVTEKINALRLKGLLP